MIYDIHALPATYGDCLVIEYGEEGAIHRILIDGGTGGTRKHIGDYLDKLPENERHFELVVVTHLDKDHIEGVLRIMQKDEVGFSAGDFWFNSWKHLPADDAAEEFGALQAEYLTGRIIHHDFPWNVAFNGEAVTIQNDFLPLITLPGGMRITLLSPGKEQLKALRPKWTAEVLRESLHPGFGETLEEEELEEDSDLESMGEAINVDALNNVTFEEDDAVGNGSSIAFLAEYGGVTALFAGDAFPSIVLESLNRLQAKKFPIALLKLSHHGSRGNTSPALIEKLVCQHYLLSTNGSIYKHPHPETIARVIKRGSKNPRFYFNYRTDFNVGWENPSLQRVHTYSTRYAQNDLLSISLLE